MLEARLAKAGTFKKLIEAIKELVNDSNFDCNSNGISLQAMDSSHVALVSLMLRNDGFEQFRCDRVVSLGINLSSLSKVLKCAGNDDVLTLRADQTDTLALLFENEAKDRISEFELKLMDIDAEHLGIPDTKYKCYVKMPAAEFQRICREIATIGDTVQISVTKEGVKFAAQGDIGSGNIVVRQDSSADKKDEEQTVIKIDEAVSLTFALRYLNQFAKATPLSPTVRLCLSPGVPLVVEYPIEEIGQLRFYLAPKIDEE